MTGAQGTPEADTLVASSGGAPAARERPLVRGSLVGRYVILDVLGKGSMGVVYVAYDPKLDRKVALKLLHATHAEAQRRLLREAQALAKLSHPNIVAVHDVGSVGERVWIAMELVAGKTLRAWLRDHPRSWREALFVMIAAGRGLAHAHASELVHRDFKPDNVMVGDDGRVRVMDFGLALSTDETAAIEPQRGPQGDRDSTRDTIGETTHTRSGAVNTATRGLVGTPAYMAPEQFAGDRVGAAADQFAFCIALWESVYAERPFGGDTLVSLSTCVLAGERRPPPRGVRVPPWLRRAMERGLARDAGTRWPSMDALLEVLERGQTRAHRRRIAAGLGGIAMLGAVAVILHALDRHRSTTACDEAGARISGVWNADARSELQAALLATDVAYARTTAERVTRRLDEHAQAWRAAATQACLDANVRDTWDAELLDRAQWCLDGQMEQMDALVQALRTPDAVVMPRAIEAVTSLARAATCRDARLLERSPPPPVERRDEAREIRASLFRVQASHVAGRYEEALRLALEVTQRADALGWSPLVASTRAHRARLHEAMGAYDEAEGAGIEAYHEAVRAGAWDVAATASIDLVMVVGHRQARPSKGLAWARHARDALVHAGDVEEIREAHRLHHLASVHARARRPTEARPLLERALGIREAVYGPEHPAVAVTLNNLGNILDDLGDFEEAKRALERALAIKEKAFGRDHPLFASTLSGLGLMACANEELDRCKDLLEQALEIDEAAFGSDHPRVATDLGNLASAYVLDDRLEPAREYLERARDAWEAAFGPDHPEVASARFDLADLHLRRGEHEQALREAEQAFAIHERALPPDDPALAEGLLRRAEIARAASRLEEWRDLLERALSIYEASEKFQVLELTARFNLAEALLATGGDRERVLSLAEQARARFHEQGVDDAIFAAKLETFLRTNAL